MSRGWLVCVLTAICSAALGQGYTERWRVLTTPTQTNERILWERVACTGANEVIAAGFAENGTPPPAHGPVEDVTRTLLLAKFDPDGNPIWETRDFTAPENDFRVSDFALDGSGNVYVAYVKAPGFADINSYSAATGQFRWSFSVAVDPNEFRPVRLSVRTAGNTTFVYAGVDKGTSFDLLRFNSANGSATQVLPIAGGTSAQLVGLDTDANGNVFLGQIIDGDGVIRKLTQGFSAVWTQVFAQANDGRIAFDPTSNRLLVALSAQLFSPSLVSLNGTNGSIAHTLTLPREFEGVSNLTRGLFGSWYMVNNFDGGVGVLELTTTLKPLTKSLFSKTATNLALDTSGQVHFGNIGTQLLSFAIRRRAADGLFETQIGQGAGARFVACDGAGRVVGVGSTQTGEGVIIQLDQQFLANTDVIVRDFTGPLTIEAPGVLANDSNWFGGTLSVVTQPTEGTVTLNQDGSFTYIPGANYDGTDQFQYRITKDGVPRTATCVVKQLVITQLSLEGNTIVGEDLGSGTISINNASLPFEFVPNISVSSPLVTLGVQRAFRTGTTSGSFQFRTVVVTASANVVFTVTSSGQSRTATLTITPGGLKDIITIGGAPLIEGQASNLTLRLTGIAPSERIYGLELTGPITGTNVVTVPAGQSQAGLILNAASGTAGQSAKIRTFAGGTPVEFIFPIQAKAKLESLAPSTGILYAGTTFSVIARLDGRTGTSSQTLSFSDNSGTVTSPSSITIGPGKDFGTASVLAGLAAANSNVTFTAGLDGVFKTSTVLIRNNLLETFTVSPNVINIRQTATGSVGLNWVAPARGQIVEISTDKPALVIVPAFVTVPEGQFSAQFAIKPKSTGTATISVRIGQKKLTRTLTITP